MKPNETVEVPVWIVNKVLMSIGMMNDCIEEECCLKRQICSSYRLLNLYSDGNVPTDQQITDAIIKYLDCDIN